MSFGILDYFLILSFFLFILFIIIKGAKSNQHFPHFFNAGGKLNWLLIGVSILATNISFQYIMNSAYDGFSVGMAYGSYEWTAAFIMIIVALYFVPHFLRIGVLTLPEYLEFRFNRTTRIFMAIIFILLQIGMIIPNLISNAIFIENIWGIPKIISISFIAATGGILIFSGGLASKIRLDLMVVCLFFFSGLILLILCLVKVEGFANFINSADGRLAVALPSDHEVLPWTSVFIGGLWFLHIQYWAFYQPIAQTVLASASLSQAQKGILFVATAKLVTPVLMLVPGIIGYELYVTQISSIENALPVIIKNVVPYGLGGIIIIGYLSTMFATFTGYLNATVVVFTNDVFQHVIPEEKKKNKMVTVAKITTIILVMLSILLSFYLELDGALLKFSLLLLVGVAPLSTAVFLFAIFSRRTPTIAALIVMVIGIPLFILLKHYLHMSNINISGTAFLILVSIMLLIRLVFPLKTPVVMPEKFAVKFERNLTVEIWGIFILTAVCAIYTLLL